jgi:hypothetical protein
MSSIAKLRQEFKKERDIMNKMIENARDDMVRKKTSPPRVTVPVELTVVTKFKLEVDPTKLEETIKKACVPVEKKNIVFLESLPKKTPTPSAASQPKPVAICQARNLNGTPCKCKAKVGKFCVKHSS